MHIETKSTSFVPIAYEIVVYATLKIGRDTTPSRLVGLPL